MVENVNKSCGNLSLNTDYSLKAQVVGINNTDSDRERENERKII